MPVTVYILGYIYYDMTDEEGFQEVKQQATELFDFDVGDRFRLFSRSHTDEDSADWEEYQVECRVLMIDYGEMEHEYPDAPDLSKQLVYDLRRNESSEIKTAPEVHLKESDTVEYISD
jgi:hypothetical protein